MYILLTNTLLYLRCDLIRQSLFAYKELLKMSGTDADSTPEQQDPLRAATIENNQGHQDQDSNRSHVQFVGNNGEMITSFERNAEASVNQGNVELVRKLGEDLSHTNFVYKKDDYDLVYIQNLYDFLGHMRAKLTTNQTFLGCGGEAVMQLMGLLSSLENGREPVKCNKIIHEKDSSGDVTNVQMGLKGIGIAVKLGVAKSMPELTDGLPATIKTIVAEHDYESSNAELEGHVNVTYDHQCNGQAGMTSNSRC